MHRYASTFITGLKKFIGNFIEEKLSNVKILLLFDGLIVYQTDTELNKLKKLRCFNNTFIVLRIFNKLSTAPIYEMLHKISKDNFIENTILSNLELGETGKTFRLIASNENEFVSINNALRVKIENKIKLVRKLHLNKSKPDIEFWFLYRSEGYGLFLKRITSHTAYEKLLERGELRPELSHILCLMSRPHEHDIFLDPFCGYGSIPIERSLSFPFNMIFSTDNDLVKIKYIRNKIKNIPIKGTFIPKLQNALDLKSFEDNFIHKIVTDPPWGIFEKMDMDISNFYYLMIQEFHRVLKREGIMVILTARKTEFENALVNFSESLKLTDKYDILVSGKKAAIYQIVKVQ